MIKWIKLTYNINLSDIYIAFNSDYSKYALKRDQLIIDICLKYNINLIKLDSDYTLISFENMVKLDQTAYKQFGAFYKNAIKYIVPKPIQTKYSSYLNKQIITLENIKNIRDIENIKEYDILKLNIFYTINDKLVQNGGRSNANKQLNNLNKFKSYNLLKDRLDYTTTNLSAYLNFGCISIREVYYQIKKKLGSTTLILKQLYWRDFYLQALKYLPNGNEFIHMDKRYEQIKWASLTTTKSNWHKLINSKTGFLIIDAAMNEMKITGFMHNRARMIVANFWTKYLLINIFDPIYGSQVNYSKYLVDAIGPSQNKLNHQWITEFDYSGKKYAPSKAVIAGRPMNPSNIIIKKFDPNCIYIKKWLKHLSDIPNKDLIKWNNEMSIKYNNIHPAPMFDYKEKYKEWINACLNI